MTSLNDLIQLVKTQQTEYDSGTVKTAQEVRKIQQTVYEKYKQEIFSMIYRKMLERKYPSKICIYIHPDIPTGVVDEIKKSELAYEVNFVYGCCNCKKTIVLAHPTYYRQCIDCNTIIIGNYGGVVN